MSDGEYLDVTIKPCPWCKKTPILSLPIDEHTGGTWLWSIFCDNWECRVKPSGSEIGIRRTTKESWRRQKAKIVLLVNDWNEGLCTVAYESMRVYKI